MPPIDQRYYYEDHDRHGNLRRYFRRRVKGSKKVRKVRLREEPSTAEFYEEFAAALAGRLYIRKEAPPAPRRRRAWWRDRCAGCASATCANATNFASMTRRPRRSAG